MCPAVEPRLITCPRPRATMPGTTARVTWSRPFTLVSIISSQSSVFASYTLSVPRDRPALLTRTSTTAHSEGRPLYRLSDFIRVANVKRDGVGCVCAGLHELRRERFQLVSPACGE